MIFNKKIHKMNQFLTKVLSVRARDTKKPCINTRADHYKQDKLSISIVIPTLNEEKHIKDCLNSVFSQTYYSKIIEIFVVDGGSTDQTLEIVSKIRSDHPNLYLIDNKKKIQAAAFNIGIDNFKGDLLVRLDAHCTYDLKYIQYCVQYHSSYGYGNVGGRCIIKPGADTNMAKIIAIVSSSPFGLGFATFRVGKKITLTDTIPFGSFTKKVLYDVGKMNESLPRGEDNEYNARIRKSGYKILFDPKIVSHYYSSPDLNTFINKFFTNGFSIGILLRVSKRSVGFRHIIPLVFLIVMISGITLSLFNSFFIFAILSLFSVYFLAIFIFGVKRFSKYEIKLIPIYIYVVLLLHLFYGAGTMLGLIKGKYK
jgi:glycosyltransferase involved in cell wall biosynthesis